MFVVFLPPQDLWGSPSVKCVWHAQLWSILWHAHLWSVFGTHNCEERFGIHNYETYFGMHNYEARFGMHNYEAHFGMHNCEAYFGMQVCLACTTVKSVHTQLWNTLWHAKLWSCEACFGMRINEAHFGMHNCASPSIHTAALSLYKYQDAHLVSHSIQLAVLEQQSHLLQRFHCILLLLQARVLQQALHHLHATCRAHDINNLYLASANTAINMFNPLTTGTRDASEVTHMY